MADREDFHRLALADDLHLTWDRHLLTVASSRWEPGVFVYDLAYLIVETKPVKHGVGVALGSRGAHFTFNVVRFELDGPQFARFEQLLARVRGHRDRLMVETPR